MPSAPGYPQTYAARGVPSSFTQPPQSVGSGAPTTRIIAFRLANLVVNTRVTRSFGPFVGPALIRHFAWAVDNAVANASATLGLGIASAAITENDVAMTTLKGWRAIIEQGIHDSPEPPLTNEGFYQATTATAEGLQRARLDYIVNESSFFVTVTAYAPAASGDRWIGNFTVVENVRPEALANFL